MGHLSQDAGWLEVEAHAELDLALAVDGVGGGGGGVEVGVVLQLGAVFGGVVGGVEGAGAVGDVGVVEEVEGLGEELEVASGFAEGDVAGETQVGVVEVAVAEAVASEERQAGCAS